MIESICAIGFSGHRELPDAEQTQQKIAQLLDDIGQKTPSRLVGVSSVAVGADLIFIEACLRRNLPWLAILPMPASMFFNKKDFHHEKDRLQAMALLETAAYVEVTNPVSDENLESDPEYRKAAFSDSGQRIVDYSDIFIAALRQTHDPPKPGGTGDILQYAKQRGRPLAIINPDTGHVEHHHWNPPFLSDFVAEIASLPDTPLRQEFLAADSSRELRAVVDFFSRLSGAARRHVPRLRSISSLAVILNTCVAIFGFALIELPKVLSRIPAEVPLRVATGILGVAALGVTVWFIVGKPHKRAARYRLGAEICRSVIATWKLPETHRHIFRGLPSEYRQFLRGLLNLRRLEGPTLAGARSNQQATADVSNESISEYVTSRLDKQLSYYQREQNKAQRRFHWLVPLIAILASAQLLIELGGVVAWWRGHFPVTERANILHEILMFSRVVFAALTGMFITLLAVREATRRKGRYGEMLEVLKENAERLNFATHKQAACEVITDNERVLLAENIEWANTAKYPATV